jgi:cobalt transporter subunit CbtA
MTIFRTIVFVAAAAGFMAGLALSAIQIFSTVPLIQRAESFEKAGDKSAAPAAHAHAPGTPAHADTAWQLQDGLERLTYTVASNIVGAIGFALLLVSLSEIAGGIASWRQGIYWGLGGFASFTLAPSLGLPPELPGMPSAELLDRQIWWLATAALTSCGLAMIVFLRSLLASFAGIGLIVAPHVIGAPHPASFESAVPHLLAHQFAVAAIVSGFVFWVLLGIVAGAVRRRLTPGG